jgi:hypothetical protein
MRQPKAFAKPHLPESGASGRRERNPSLARGKATAVAGLSNKTAAFFRPLDGTTDAENHNEKNCWLLEYNEGTRVRFGSAADHEAVRIHVRPALNTGS